MESTKKPDVEELGEKVGTYVNKIVKKYNRTRTGFLSPNETQVMLQHYTGIQVSLKDITDFLKSNNDSSNGQASIGENDLRDIIQRGISLSPKERENYISQGHIYDVLIQFFDGVAREMKTLNRPIANFMELMSGSRSSGLLDKSSILFNCCVPETAVGIVKDNIIAPSPTARISRSESDADL